MFYRITDNGLEKAPKMLEINGKQVFTNSEKIYNENGYYRVKELPLPTGEGSFKPVYHLEDNLIIKGWQKVEIEPLPYKDRVINRIRERYSIDDEFAILRQRDTKPEEFYEYNVFVEGIKKVAKIKNN